MDKTLEMFDVIHNHHIVEGFCVVVKNGHIIYAGPITGSEIAVDAVMFLGTNDFEKLKEHMDLRRH